MPVLASPLIRRVAWHIRRVGGSLDRRFFLTLAEGIVGFVLIAAIFITLFEKTWTFESIFDSFNWGIATVLGQGDSAFVTSPAGRIVGWLLILFGVAMLGMITGALVAMVIDFLLKEGQGLGASGFKDHIIVCGWNSTARDLIEELKGDDYHLQVVVLADADKNPGPGSTSSAATPPTPRTWTGPASSTPRSPSCSRSTAATRPTCSRS
jgi:voltage-gated potassium channel